MHKEIKMKSIGKVLKRNLRGEFGKRKNPLPKKLSFLSNISFYAITECLPPKSDVRQTRIEILPASLKKLASSHEKYKVLNKKYQEVLSIFKNAEQLFIEQQEYMEKLERANAQLLKNLGQGPETPRSEIQTYLQRAEEIGFISHGLPLQGGLPSLGKKR